MTIFIPGNTAVENTRNLAQSALPDAPVVADEPLGNRRTGPEVRARVGALLRTAAQRQQRLADRIDPVADCAPQPG